jgi:pimeloyl-ACP methyl ester carboxylesterase
MIRPYLYPILILFTLVISPAQGDQISLPMTDGNIATADYRPGSSDSPLLLFVHGFLQTRNFSTVKRLADSLHDSEFSVLSPTLTLGISNRVKSLPCESIHTHSMQDDTQEIATWINWAVDKGHDNIILIGHSAGSVNITGYLAGAPNPAVSKSILISLYYYGPNRRAANETVENYQQALKLKQTDPTAIGDFALSFCEKYISTADDFLSYYNWGKDKVINAIDRSSPQTYVIIGSADNRLSMDWVDKMKKTRAQVIVIDGANHFFDQAYEFDLLDEVESIITD